MSAESSTTKNVGIGDQIGLGTILQEAEEASPISVTGKEIEQKYLFASGLECDHLYTGWDEQLRKHFQHIPTNIASFDGIDYYYTVESKGKVYPFRLRTGRPVHNRLGVKAKREGEEQVRDEFELNLAPDSSLQKVLSVLNIIGNLGESCIESHIHVKGNIRYFNPVMYEPGKRIEVVIFIGTNLLKNVRVFVAEIEIHGFVDIVDAKKEIFKLEAELGWKDFRTDKSMSQLLA